MKKFPQRPPPDALAQAELLGELGGLDVDLARLFGIQIRMLYKWKKRHPELVEALNRGKAKADRAVVKSLYHRACGYSHPAVKIFIRDGIPTTVDYIEHYPPDTGACIFWLKNRRPDLWRDVVVQEHSGEIDHNHAIDPAELAIARRVARERAGFTIPKQVTRN